MLELLHKLSLLPVWQQGLILLIENLIIIYFSVFIGIIIQKKEIKKSVYSYSSKQIYIPLVTCFVNTFITYAGFWLWENHYLSFTSEFSARIFIDSLLLLICMDILMFIFHYFIHKTPLHRFHDLHHEAMNPNPIDLYVLHPVETLGFGFLWIGLLLFIDMNIYGVIFFAVINVLFGMVGHLGMEPFPEKIKNSFIFNYLGSSTFHHNHHKNGNYNFGFYTNIWDRIFRTYLK